MTIRGQRPNPIHVASLLGLMLLSAGACTPDSPGTQADVSADLLGFGETSDAVVDVPLAADVSDADGVSDTFDDLAPAEVSAPDTGQADTGQADTDDITEDLSPLDVAAPDVGPQDVTEPDTAEPLTLCEQYCVLAELHCAGPNALSFGEKPCVDVCGSWPLGEPGDALGDSLHCRLTHLGLAGADPGAHCAKGAPEGGGVCVVPDYGNDAGDTCQTAGAAVFAPSLNLGDNTNAFDDYDAGSCGFTNGAGKDVAWTLAPVMSGVYTFKLTPEAGGPNVLYVVQDCATVSDSCVGFLNGFSQDELQVPLLGGQNYSVIVDGWNAGQIGAFELAISSPCVPSCDVFQECGDDGCGGSCGTCNPTDPNGWTACDAATNTCVKPGSAIGNTCENAVPIGVLPFAFSSSTAEATNNYGYSAGTCPGVPYVWGKGSADHAFALTPTEDAIYSLTLAADFDATLYVVGQCDNIDGSCIGASESFGIETLELPLLAGTTYYVIVDGYANDFDASGDYTLSIAEPCVPNCTGGVCGSDGCGGECLCGDGELCFEAVCCTPLCDGSACGPTADGCGGSCGCAAGLTCDEAGGCVDAAQGDQCINPFEVQQNPFSKAGSTNLFADDLSVEACGPGLVAGGAGASDAVYALTPAVSGTYALKLTAAFSAVLYVVTDCANASGTCLGADASAGPKVLNVPMDGGATYFVVVDGSEAGDQGAYVLQIGAPCAPVCDGLECGPDGCGGVCGDCGPTGTCEVDQLCSFQAEVGDACSAPFQVAAFPFQAADDTSLATNTTQSTAATCFEVGGASNDHVYEVQSPGNGTLTVEVSGKDGFDPVLYARKTCDAAEAGVCSDDTTNDGAESVVLDLMTGETWFIVVDGWNNNINHAGAYDVGMTFVATPQGEPGGSCEDSLLIDAFPASVSGNTSGASDSLASTLCDPGAFPGGKDHVWRLEPTESGTYAFTLSGTPTLLYVVPGCDAVASCDGFKSFFGDPSPSLVQLEAGQVYYVVVDGYADWEAGPYTLAVSFEGDVAPASDTLIINELDYDMPGPDSAEFVEIVNPTAVNISTDGLFLVYVNGDTGLPYAIIPLAPLGMLAPGDYAVVGSPEVIQSVANGVPTLAGPFSIQNGGPDAVALVAGDPASPGAVAWDVVTYEGTLDAMSDGSSWWVSEGQTPVDASDSSLGRCPNSADTGDNGADFLLVAPTPGGPNDCDITVESVAITANSFQPSSLTISAGTQVVWTNNANISHTVTSTDGITPNNPTYSPLNSSFIQPQGTFSFVFAQPGSYTYRCEPHGEMKGMIVVE